MNTPITRLKRTLFLLNIFVFFNCFVFAQNLVVDPSFEDNSRCPSRFDDYSALNQWNRVGAGTPDYYNLCGCPGSSSCSNSAANAWNRGNQIPRTGNGMAGFIGYNYFGGLEFVSVHLSQSLEAGEVYEVEYYLSLADAHTSAIYELGLSFHNGSPTTINHYNSTSLIGPATGAHVTDKTNWVRISGSYTAMGGEDHIMIGASISDPRSMDKISVSATGARSSMAYYFIDDVSVIKSCSPPDFDLGNDTSICGSAKIILYDTIIEVNNIYTWEDGSNVVPRTITSSGTYSLTITNAGGCSKSDTIMVSTGTYPNLELRNDTTICLGDSILLYELPTSVGNTYSWEDGSNPFPRIIKNDGLFSLEITNVAGCSSKDSILISFVSNPIFHLGNDTSMCEGDSITLLADSISSDQISPGIEYTWEDGESIVPRVINVAGTYSLIIANEYGCSSTDTIDISYDPSPDFDLGNDTSMCNGDSISLFKGPEFPGDSYLWENGFTGSLRIISTPGAYSLGITNSYGCMKSDTIAIFEKTLPKSGLVSDTAICVGDSISLFNETIVIGNNYLWEDGSTLVPRLVQDSGVYVLTITQSNGCYMIDIITVNSSQRPSFSLGNDTSLCNGDSVLLYNEPYDLSVDYMWENGFGMVPRVVKSEGLFNLTITNEFGCSFTDSVLISGVSKPDVNLGNDTTFCLGDTIKLYSDEVIISSEYLWEDGSVSIPRSILEAGTYSLMAKNEAGCIKTDSIVILSSTKPIIELGDDTTLCEGDYIELFNESESIGYDYQWEDGSDIIPRVVNEIGVYQLSVKDRFGCKSMDSIMVDVSPSPLLTLNDTSFCFNQSDELILSPIGELMSSYEWDDANNTRRREVAVSAPGVYEVVYTNTFGCKGNLSVNVTGKDDCKEPFYFPTGFTPNGDGLNDVFSFSKEYFEGFELYIYNRWGELIYKGNKSTPFWDGTFNGRDVQVDVYVWVLNYSNFNGAGGLIKTNETGRISLIR